MVDILLHGIIFFKNIFEVWTTTTLHQNLRYKLRSLLNTDTGICLTHDIIQTLVLMNQSYAWQVENWKLHLYEYVPLGYWDSNESTKTRGTA